MAHKRIEEIKKNLPPDMVYVPGGYFRMGSAENDGKVGLEIGVDELPAHRVYLNPFYIDKYEVTNRQFKEFVSATGTRHPLPEYFVKKDKYPANFAIDDNPVVDIDWFTAKDYCKWKGKRLPTEAEWERAAKGDINTIWWWWGKDFSTERGNTIESGIGFPVKVGSFPKGVSPYGAYDMYGNVWEWTDSWYMLYPGNKLSREIKEKYPVIKGGAYNSPYMPFARPANRYYYPPSRYIPGVNECPGDMNIGFRCVMDVVI